MPRRTRMDGCLGSPDEMNDTLAILDGIIERDMIADDIPRLGMASRHIDPIDGDRDYKMRCDVALRDLGPSRDKVEPDDLA